MTGQYVMFFWLCGYVMFCHVMEPVGQNRRQCSVLSSSPGGSTGAEFCAWLPACIQACSQWSTKKFIFRNLLPTNISQNCGTHPNVCTSCAEKACSYLPSNLAMFELFHFYTALQILHLLYYILPCHHLF